MSKKREYTLQLLQDQSGRTASVHVTQGGKTVTPPPEPPKPEGVVTFKASPNPIMMEYYDKVENAQRHRTFRPVDVVVKSYRTVDGVKTPIPISCSITPSDAGETASLTGGPDAKGQYTILVSRASEIAGTRAKTPGSLLITQSETGATLEININGVELNQ